MAATQPALYGGNNIERSFMQHQETLAMAALCLVCNDMVETAELSPSWVSSLNQHNRCLAWAFCCACYASKIHDSTLAWTQKLPTHQHIAAGTVIRSGRRHCSLTQNLHAE